MSREIYSVIDNEMTANNKTKALSCSYIVKTMCLTAHWNCLKQAKCCNFNRGVSTLLHNVSRQKPAGSNSGNPSLVHSLNLKLGRWVHRARAAFPNLRSWNYVHRFWGVHRKIKIKRGPWGSKGWEPLA